MSLTCLSAPSSDPQASGRPPAGRGVGGGRLASSYTRAMRFMWDLCVSVCTILRAKLARDPAADNGVCACLHPRLPGVFSGPGARRGGWVHGVTLRPTPGRAVASASSPGAGPDRMPLSEPALAHCWSHMPIAQRCSRDGRPRDRGLAFVRRCRPTVGDSREISSSEHISIKWQRFLIEVKVT